MKNSSLRYLTVVVSGLLVAGCLNQETKDSKSTKADFGRCADFDPLRKPLFGDTHVHTKYSFDARTQGTDTDHVDAYTFAKGGTIDLPPYDSSGNALRSLTLDRPLDFVAISDHSEFLGAVAVCQDPEAAAYNQEECVKFREDDVAGFTGFGFYVAIDPNAARYPDICGDDAADCKAAGADIWETIQQDAEAAYDQSASCSFTSLIAYEWTGTPGTKNLHRNVIFRNETVPDNVISYFDAPEIEELWAGLRSECIDASGKCDALTIPHNSNLSDGLFFKNKTKRGQPFDIDYVTERQFMEPLIEIYQHKGASECIDGFPVADEFCQFELVDYTTFASNFLGNPSKADPGDFIRAAFGEGMKHDLALGTNPFKHGIIASTDTHVSIPGGTDERSFPGHGGAGQVNNEAGSDRVIPGLVDSPYNSAGGLAVVWAEENSREAIFKAMRQKEVYGTSGPRITVRFFGGWDYPENMCESVDFSEVGYERGVPMGSDLPAVPGSGSAPVFLLSANQDAGSDQRAGTPLQRLQIVKGWIDSNQDYQVKIFDVSANPDNGASVDVNTCEQSGTGEASLCTRWVDPEFNSGQMAYYYARVIENPSCRWSTWSCVDDGFDCQNPATEFDRACCDPVLGLNTAICTDVDCSDPESLSDIEERCCVQPIEPVVQERAWTSPIWYTPPEN